MKNKKATHEGLNVFVKQKLHRGQRNFLVYYLYEETTFTNAGNAGTRTGDRSLESSLNRVPNFEKLVPKLEASQALVSKAAAAAANLFIDKKERDYQLLQFLLL